MQILAVVHFDDPTISNYKIMEERTNTTINLGDYNQHISFGFVSNADFTPVPLDPLIGNFSLFNRRFSTTIDETAY